MKKVLPTSHSLIPGNATRVFKGVIFDVYQWPQAMFDGSTKTFEMLRRPDTVQIIVIRDKQILLVEDEQPGRNPRIHFPGGRVNEHEVDWETAARRELLEETGLVCKDWRLIDVQQPTLKIEWFAPIFLATEIIEENDQQLDVDGEKITVQWQDFEAVRNEVLSGGEQMMQYLIPFFNKVQSVEQILVLPEYKGEEIIR